MNTIIVERNFHIMNDDRFIMEKLSYPIEIEEGSDVQTVHEKINQARQILVDNFKAAYPHLKTYLNFDEVKQVNEDLDALKKSYDKVNQQLDKEAQDQIHKIKTDAISQVSQIEQSQPKYNLLKEISNCKTLTMLKVLKKMAITDEEIKACDERMSELTIGSKQEPTY